MRSAVSTTTMMTKRVCISSLIKDSAMHLSADWTEVAEYFSSISGASRAPIQPVLDAVQQLSTLTSSLQRDVESALATAVDHDHGTKLDTPDDLATVDTFK